MTPTTNHLENWLTESEAAALLHISTRTLRRRAEAVDGPEKRERQRPGARPEPVYNPDDVARLAATPAHVMPPEPPRSTMELAVPQTNALQEVLNRIAGAVEDRLHIAQPKPPARWITLKQARESSGLSIALLHRLIGAGRLRVLRDGAWKVLQADLDNLDNADEFVRDMAGLSKTKKGCTTDAE